MSTENASPVEQTTQVSEQHEDAATLDQSTEGTDDKTAEAKPERTPEERERIRDRRKIERLIAQRAELRSQLASRTPQAESTQARASDTTQHPQDANETLSLSRADLDRLIADEAKKLAPTLKQQDAEAEKRRAIVTSLAKEWGSEKFDAFAADLDDAFDGLAGPNGKPKPATDAIFESDTPAALIEYLADPDNAEEAEALSRMSAIQAGRAVAKLELKLAAQKASGKPQASKAAPPIEPLKGGGAPTKDPSRMTDQEFAAWRRASIKRR